MRSLPVVFRRAAAEDVRRTRELYEAERPGLGDAFHARLTQALVVVESNPELCQVIEPVRQVRRALTRQFAYAVYYIIDAERERSVVLAVLPASASPARWRTRR